MPRFQTLEDIDVRGKRVLLRADLNVPVKGGAVTDATRIDRLAPTIEALIEKGAKVIVMSHFGRPDGRPDPAFSLRPLVAPLSKAIGGREVAFAADCIGEEAKSVVTALRPGQVALLENLRFHKGEEQNSPDFARALAELGDVYVDDAFSAAHRAHASIAALAQLLPAAAGKLMEAELGALTSALEDPARPVLALVGGAKVSTKLDLLRFVIGKVDLLAIGGAMANTLLFAEGKEVGRSLTERDMADNARRLLALARERNCRVILPEDAVVAAELVPGTPTRNVASDAVPPHNARKKSGRHAKFPPEVHGEMLATASELCAQRVDPTDPKVSCGRFINRRIISCSKIARRPACEFVSCSRSNGVAGGRAEQVGKIDRPTAGLRGRKADIRASAQRCRHDLPAFLGPVGFRHRIGAVPAQQTARVALGCSRRSSWAPHSV